MLRFIDSHNLNELMLSDSPAKAACISATRETLTEIDNDKWYQLLMRDGNVDNGNKLRTY